MNRAEQDPRNTRDQSQAQAHRVVSRFEFDLAELLVKETTQLQVKYGDAFTPVRDNARALLAEARATGLPAEQLPPCYTERFGALWQTVAETFVAVAWKGNVEMR
jgi:hypothetical protein